MDLFKLSLEHLKLIDADRSGLSANYQIKNATDEVVCTIAFIVVIFCMYCHSLTHHLTDRTFCK